MNFILLDWVNQESKLKEIHAYFIRYNGKNELIHDNCWRDGHGPKQRSKQNRNARR